MSRVLRWAPAILVLGAIGLLTLQPTWTPVVVPRYCLLCGSRGAADLILNLVLFVPLGASLAFALEGLRRPVLTAVVISAGIELLQYFVPGRHPSPSDLLANGVGAAMGARLVLEWARLRRLEGVGRGVFVGLWAVLFFVFYLGGAAGFRPALTTAGTPFAQVQPDLAYLPLFTGRVTEPRLAHDPFPVGPLNREQLQRALYSSDEGISVVAQAGNTPSRGLAPLLSIFDDDGYEILLLGWRWPDLVVRYRTVARGLKMDRPAWVWPGALADVAGRPVRVAARFGPEGPCLALDSSGWRCDVGPTVLDAWRHLLAVPEAGLVWRLLGVAILLGWLLPLAVWTRPREQWVWGGAVVFGFASAPALGPVQADWAGVLVAVAAVLLTPRIRGWRVPRTTR